jgi:internalin A
MTNEELLKVIEEAKASGVTELDLIKRKITALPPELFQLTNLTKLDLKFNQLVTLPPEISLLTSLTELYLSNNNFITVPSEVFQMKSLIAFSLGGPNLATLPPELFQLTNLRYLNLSHNQLTTIPPEICHLAKLKYLHLDGNPITSPPIEIANQGINAIRQYFAAFRDNRQHIAQGTGAIGKVLQKEEPQPLNQVKVLLVGDGAAGKTSLVKRLLGEAFNQHEDTTHGISIRGWEVEAGGQPVKVNIWDFGGQEIMHATHQFFLSKRSLYVLVLDGRKDERAEYWLQHIESFGGDSPVLVVLNKQDSNPSFDLNRPFLQGKYTGIRQFFRTSCADGRGIAQFKAALIEELGKVPMIGIRWPQSWFAVKQRIGRASPTSAARSTAACALRRT